jgi:hypothetical protein
MFGRYQISAKIKWVGHSHMRGNETRCSGHQLELAYPSSHYPGCLVHSAHARKIGPENCFAIIRWLLGSLILFFNWLFTPRGIKHDPELQAQVDLQTTGLKLYQ